jgi:hypothetical protein
MLKRVEAISGVPAACKSARFVGSATLSNRKDHKPRNKKIPRNVLA